MFCYINFILSIMCSDTDRIARLLPNVEIEEYKEIVRPTGAFKQKLFVEDVLQEDALDDELR